MELEVPGAFFHIIPLKIWSILCIEIGQLLRTGVMVQSNCMKSFDMLQNTVKGIQKGHFPIKILEEKSSYSYSKSTAAVQRVSGIVCENLDNMEYGN